MAVLASALTVFFEVANQAFFPSLVQREHLVESNSTFGTSATLAEIGGPALAGSLVQWLSAPLAIFFDAVSFLFSALFVGLIRKPDRFSGRANSCLHFLVGGIAPFGALIAGVLGEIIGLRLTLLIALLGLLLASLWLFLSPIRQIRELPALFA